MNNYVYINENLRFVRIDSRNWQLERRFSEEENQRNRRALEGLKGKKKADTLDMNEWSHVGYYSRLNHLFDRALEAEFYDIKEIKEIKERIEKFNNDVLNLLEDKDLRKSLIQMSSEKNSEETD